MNLKLVVFVYQLYSPNAVINGELIPLDVLAAELDIHIEIDLNLINANEVDFMANAETNSAVEESVAISDPANS